MLVSDRLDAGLVPNLVPNLSGNVGKRKALRCNDVPNLPNLPNLRRVCTCTPERTRPHVHMRAYVCEQSVYRLGRLGRLGRSSNRAVLLFPTLFLRLGRLGNNPGKTEKSTWN